MNFPPIPANYTKHLQSRGYSPDEIEASWQLYQIVENEMCSAESGQIILDYCFQKGYAPQTKFSKWHEGYVTGRDPRNRRILVIGSFSNFKFVLRGTIQQKSFNRTMNFSLNGQAEQGSIQLAFIGEQDSVPFSEWDLINQKVMKKYQKTA
jgi:hypothetical protein